MKTLALAFPFLLLTPVANAQWRINVQGGVQKVTGFGQQPYPNSKHNYDYITPSTGSAIGAYVVTDRNQPVNLGLGLSFKTNHINRYARLNDENYYSPFRGTTELKIDHKSAYLSIHPVLDVNIDKNRYFHLLLNPVVSFFVIGGESGYRYFNSATVSRQNNYDNSGERIRKFLLGASAQLQFQYPLTERLRPLIAIGYSISHTPTDFIPNESGNISFQLGMSYKVQAAKKER